MPLEPFSNKWLAFGFEVFECDMINNIDKLTDILTQSQVKPRIIICHTVKGFGSSILEQDLSWHHKNSVTSEEISLLKKSLRVIK